MLTSRPHNRYYDPKEEVDEREKKRIIMEIMHNFLIYTNWRPHAVVDSSSSSSRWEHRDSGRGIGVLLEDLLHTDDYREKRKVDGKGKAGETTPILERYIRKDFFASLVDDRVRQLYSALENKENHNWNLSSPSFYYYHNNDSHHEDNNGNEEYASSSSISSGNGFPYWDVLFFSYLLYLCLVLQGDSPLLKRKQVTKESIYEEWKERFQWGSETSSVNKEEKDEKEEEEEREKQQRLSYCFSLFPSPEEVWRRPPLLSVIANISETIYYLMEQFHSAKSNNNNKNNEEEEKCRCVICYAAAIENEIALQCFLALLKYYYRNQPHNNNSEKGEDDRIKEDEKTYQTHLVEVAITLLLNFNRQENKLNSSRDYNLLRRVVLSPFFITLVENETETEINKEEENTNLIAIAERIATRYIQEELNLEQFATSKETEDDNSEDNELVKREEEEVLNALWLLLDTFWGERQNPSSESPPTFEEEEDEDYFLFSNHHHHPPTSPSLKSNHNNNNYINDENNKKKIRERLEFLFFYQQFPFRTQSDTTTTNTNNNTSDTITFVEFAAVKNYKNVLRFLFQNFIDHDDNHNNNNNKYKFRYVLTHTLTTLVRYLYQHYASDEEEDKNTTSTNKNNNNNNSIRKKGVVEVSYKAVIRLLLLYGASPLPSRRLYTTIFTTTTSSLFSGFPEDIRLLLLQPHEAIEKRSALPLYSNHNNINKNKNNLRENIKQSICPCHISQLLSEAAIQLYGPHSAVAGNTNHKETSLHSALIKSNKIIRLCFASLEYDSFNAVAYGLLLSSLQDFLLSVLSVSSSSSSSSSFPSLDGNKDKEGRGGFHPRCDFPFSSLLFKLLCTALSLYEVCWSSYEVVGPSIKEEEWSTPTVAKPAVATSSILFQKHNDIQEHLRYQLSMPTAPLTSSSPSSSLKEKHFTKLFLVSEIDPDTVQYVKVHFVGLLSSSTPSANNNNNNNNEKKRNTTRKEEVITALKLWRQYLCHTERLALGHHNNNHHHNRNNNSSNDQKEEADAFTVWVQPVRPNNKAEKQNHRTKKEEEKEGTVPYKIPLSYFLEEEKEEEKKDDTNANNNNKDDYYYYGVIDMTLPPSHPLRQGDRVIFEKRWKKNNKEFYFECVSVRRKSKVKVNELFGEDWFQTLTEVYNSSLYHNTNNNNHLHHNSPLEWLEVQSDVHFIEENNSEISHYNNNSNKDDNMDEVLYAHIIAAIYSNQQSGLVQRCQLLLESVVPSLMME